MKIAILDNDTLEAYDIEKKEKFNLADSIINYLSLDLDEFASTANKYLRNKNINDPDFLENLHAVTQEVGLSKWIDHQQLMSSLQFWKNVPERYLYDSNILTYYIETYLYACLIFLDSAAKIKNIPEGETPSAQIRYFIFKSQGTLYDAFEVELLDDFLYFAAVKIMQSKTIVIKWCPNCNKPFIPSTRSDEIYCSRIFRGNRTCKQVGYENKSGPIKAYRSAYKTKNAIKNRNIKNNPHAETDFRKWVYDAKLKLEEAQSGRISLREFKEWLKK